MKIKKILSSMFKTKIGIIISAILLLSIIAGIIFLASYNPTPNVDVTFLTQILREKSDLITAELNITSVTEYKDSGVKFINKSDFIMMAKATVWAGIDVEEVKIKADNANKIIYISIPKSTIQNAKVDESSIKYFDEKVSLFNKDVKQDVAKAIEEAEKNAKQEAENCGLLKLADKQSEILIKGLLANVVPKEYSIETKFID